MTISRENHQCYLVMEYIEGDDLESLLAVQAPRGFPEERVTQWAAHHLRHPGIPSQSEASHPVP